MGARLVLTGEIQVDIRRFVAVEAQERLEWDVMPVLEQLRAAFRAVLVRHIEAGAVFTGGDEFAVLAFRADVVRHEGIYLGDTRHARHERRADRSSRTDMIPVLLGVVYQLLCDHVKHRKAVLDDGRKLTVKPLVHDLRERVTVDLLGACMGDAHQILLGTGDVRSEGALRDREYALARIGKVLRVRDDDFLCLLRAQIAEFLQHFIRGAQIQGRLVFGIREALPGGQDLAVDAVLRIQKMHVAGRHNRDMQLFTERDDLTVVIPQRLLILREPLADHEFVVGDGLDFEVIVEFGKIFKIGIILAVHQCREQLTCLTRRAEDQTVAVLLQHGLREKRMTVVVIQMPVGHQAVKILQSHLIAHQNDLVIGFEFLDIDGIGFGIQVIEDRHTLFLLKLLYQIDVDLGKNRRILVGAVMPEGAELEVLDHNVQLMTVELRQAGLTENQRIDPVVLEIDVVIPCHAVEKRCIEGRIVCRKNGMIAAEFHELAQRLALLWGIGNHFIGDARQLGDILRNVAFGIDERVKAVHDLHPAHLDRTDFRQTVAFRGKSGGLHVEDDDLVVNAALVIAVEDLRAVEVVDHIGFAAVDDLEIGILNAADRVHRIREALHNTVIGDGNCRKAPVIRPLDEIACRGDGIHRGHVGMAVQLDALFALGGGILPLLSLAQDDGIRLQNRFACERIILNLAGNEDALALFELAQRQRLELFHRIKQLERDRTGEIRDLVGDNAPVAANILGFRRENIAVHNHTLVPGLECDGDRDRLIADHSALDEHILALDRIHLHGIARHRLRGIRDRGRGVLKAIRRRRGRRRCRLIVRRNVLNDMLKLLGGKCVHAVERHAHLPVKHAADKRFHRSGEMEFLKDGIPAVLQLYVDMLTVPRPFRPVEEAVDDGQIALEHLHKLPGTVRCQELGIIARINTECSELQRRTCYLLKFQNIRKRCNMRELHNNRDISEHFLVVLYLLDHTRLHRRRNILGVLRKEFHERCICHCFTLSLVIWRVCVYSFASSSSSAGTI